MPPEWHPHQCCWMAWPREHGEWPVGVEAVRRNFVEIALTIGQFEPVQILVDPADAIQARRTLPASFELIEIPLNDCWMRDMGPTMVLDRESGSLAGVDWVYNAWGKFSYDRDQHVARLLLEHLGIPRIDSPIVNEGGAIHVNGEGWCVLTRGVQLNPNRNPHVSQAEIESELTRTLGVERFLWLERGLVDDDTDGHVDELLCFVSPHRALVLTSADQTDANYHILAQTARDLGQMQSQSQGLKVEQIPLQQPPPRYLDGVRLSRSYVNLYLANGGIVMPSYGEKTYDDAAFTEVSRSFPERTVIQVDCSALVTGGGNIHCITQQCPMPGVRNR